MWEISLALIGGYLLYHYLSWKKLFRDDKLSHKNPPSFYGLPVFGSLPFFAIKKLRIRLLRNLSENPAFPVFRTRFLGLGEDVIFINGCKPVQEAFRNNDLLGREWPVGFHDVAEEIFGGVKPFFLLQGEEWRVQKRFLIHALKDLGGYGKSTVIERVVSDELENLTEELVKMNGKPVYIDKLLGQSMFNNIASFVRGTRLDYDTHSQRNYSDVICGSFRFADKILAVCVPRFVFQFLKQFEVFGVMGYVRVANTIKDRFFAELEQHKKTFNPDELRDLMDCYVAVSRENPDNTYVKHMFGMLSSILLAGSHTLQITVDYLLQLAAAYPHYQRRIQDEINEYIGENETPTYSDMEKMHFTRAFIAERHRFFTLTPIGVLRTATQDTTVCGYHIAKGSLVFYNLLSAHTDPRVWNRPHEFLPDRFLNMDGTFRKDNNVMPFAQGRRACPGESMGEQETFLYFVSLLQRFTVLPESPGTKIELAENEGWFAELPIRQKLRLMDRKATKNCRELA
ncbi:cytochrome P450 2B4-like [Varroa jacobsoni]|uniref:Cytochrome P450 n=1 Tax=Varroa destructor TaxID=109461 RepID=A0A7M7JPW8_VARDE|nr:cytochrome P450 2B4-like [Varroa destructor]XP_022700144.1 cytochrome P450 2B4-like [Varroa jacobsoni]